MGKQTLITFSARTDRGKERPSNEDGIVAWDFSSVTNSVPFYCGLFAISDGMGGHNAGEIASMTAIKSISATIFKEFLQKLIKIKYYKLPNSAFNYHFRKKKTQSPPNADRILRKAIQKANSDIVDLSRKNPAFFGMGATITAAIIADGVLTVANVGDSRCYYIEKENIAQITNDHTIVNQMIALGRISKKEAMHHPGKNFLYKSLGADEEIEIDIFEKQVSPPAWIVLCSDGLSNMVTDNEILNTVLHTKTPHRATKKLIGLANKAGGTDNISAIVVKVANS